MFGGLLERASNPKDHLLKVNRTCPLCRRDLAESLESGDGSIEAAMRAERIGASDSIQVSSVSSVEPETPASDGLIAYEEPPRNHEVVVQANTRQR